MKKILSSILALVLMLSTIFSVNVFANDISVYVDNELVQLTDATGANVYPFIQNGTTYVPLRGISETLDCDVVWDGNNNTVLIYKEMQSDNSAFRNNSDEIKLYVDNKLVELKDANETTVKPFIKDGTTYVPLRGVSQALGCWVRWDGQTKTVSVYMNEIPPDGVTLTENKPYESWAVDEYYETDGNQLEIDNIKYTNALEFYLGDAAALFNLDGKFENLSCIIGHKSHTYNEKYVTFVVDGKIVDTINLEAEELPKEINIDLNKGLQLKIQNGGGGGDIGMGNIIFWGE